MSLKKIKLFIASSSEMEDDREAFASFIGRENERLIEQDIFIQLVRWEYFLDTISDSNKQDDYNDAIRECDMVLCLFFTKVGKYTAQEFDTAYDAFKSTGKPKIWTYFKDAPINISSITEEIMTLISFKKKIAELGHFLTEYTNIDNLKFQFRYQLDEILPEMIGRNSGKRTRVSKGLTTLNLESKQLKDLPSEILQLKALLTLSLRGNKLMALPAEIGQLRELKTLDLTDNQLIGLPEEIGQLGALYKLNLDFNRLTGLPKEVGQLKSLKTLSLRHNSLAALPTGILQLATLQTMDLSANQITGLPTEIRQLQVLQALDLSANQLTGLPATMGQLKSLKTLNLTANPFSESAILQIQSLIPYCEIFR